MISIENFTHLEGELVWRERFLEERGATIEDPSAYNFVIRVS
jgi:hypothetical protein